VPLTVLAIPGTWPMQGNIIADVVSKSDGFLTPGLDRIVNTKTDDVFGLDVRGHDPDMASLFSQTGGRGRALSPAEISAVGAHTFVLYVTGPGGTEEAARSFLHAGAGLIKAGGLAVKVMSGGVTHPAEGWLTLAAHEYPEALYHAYVMLAGEGDGRTYYSQGMHNLGLRDAIISAKIGLNDAARLLESFLLYTLLEKPSLESGHTISVEFLPHRYRVTHEACTTYPPDHLFHNPYGMWRLSSP
jgi:hypothetical protein